MTDQPAPPKKPRKRDRSAPTAYETRTPEKVAMGKRMAEAREAARLTATALSEKMGYAQPVQLSQMETGKRPATLEVIIGYAEICGTTTDFLLGLSQDVDRDPATILQGSISKHLSAVFTNLVGQVSTMSVDLARTVLPDVAEGQRLAVHLLEVNKAMQEFMAANPRFQDARGSSKVYGRITRGADAAAQYVGKLERTRRASTITSGYAAMGNPIQMSMLPALEAVCPPVPSSMFPQAQPEQATA